jgi:hypothetical protein
MSSRRENTPLDILAASPVLCTKMDQYFPDLREYGEFREPFLGGGSVAIHVTKKYPDLEEFGSTTSMNLLSTSGNNSRCLVMR